MQIICNVLTFSGLVSVACMRKVFSTQNNNKKNKAMGQIIKLNTNSNSKDFNGEKFEISIKKEIEIKGQNECKHIEIEVDSDEDLHNCLKCGKKFTAHEYLVFKALDNSRIKFHSYTLKNDIHFLEQEKVQLENFVNDLKSQKHKLSSWITRTKKQNDIKNNDWNATSKG